MAQRDTQNQILDIAQRLVQSHGYNAFSYRDLANEIGIKSASIHYHFPTKDDLGTALVRRYRQAFLTDLARIEDQTDDAGERLTRFAGLFGAVLRQGNRICLCGMLATDFITLPKGVQNQVKRFFKDSEDWLTKVLADGEKSGALELSGTPRTTARTLFAALEGMLIGAHVFADRKRFDGTVRTLLRGLVKS